MIALMDALGCQRFDVLAHDRGARVAHRLAADHPQAVRRLVVLDIAPTLAMYEQTTEAFARAYWHWFFLIQPAPLPERLIEADPAAYVRDVMGRRSAGLAPVRSACAGRIPALPRAARRRARPVRRLPRRRRHRSASTIASIEKRAAHYACRCSPCGVKKALCIDASRRSTNGAGWRRASAADPCRAATTSPKRHPRDSYKRFFPSS